MVTGQKIHGLDRRLANKSMNFIINPTTAPPASQSVYVWNLIKLLNKRNVLKEIFSLVA